MRIEDREEFDVALCDALSIFDKPPLEEGVFNIWMKVLTPFSLAQAIRALKIHVATSRFAPKPVDIIEIINKQDGHLSADEAWPQVIKAADESVSVIWTEEMQAAWFHCKPTFDSGDEIGARMAFRQFYNRLLDEARLRGLRAKPSLSLGFDTDLREQTIRKAEYSGLISHDQALHQLPAPKTNEGDVLRIGHGMQVSVSESASVDFRQKLRKALADANAITEAKRADAKVEREQKKESEEARRKELMRQACILEGEK